MNVPLFRRAHAQQNRAVRAPPMWRWPVGDGAKRVMTGGWCGWESAIGGGLYQRQEPNTSVSVTTDVKKLPRLRRPLRLVMLVVSIGLIGVVILGNILFVSVGRRLGKQSETGFLLVSGLSTTLAVTRDPEALNYVGFHTDEPPFPNPDKRARGSIWRPIKTQSYSYEVFYGDCNCDFSLSIERIRVVRVSHWFSGIIASGILGILFFTRSRYSKDHCRTCNYDLRGLTSTTCPECGSELKNSDKTQSGVC